MTNAKWFILEDDRELVSELEELGKLRGVKPVVAHCVDDAVARVVEMYSGEKEVPPARVVAFIDMMVPKTVTDLASLINLIEARDGIISSSSTDHSRPKSSGIGDARHNTRHLLKDIDYKIHPLIDINGGFTFLSDVIVRSHLASWEVIIYSARTQPANWSEIKTQISNRIEWRQKPARPQDIITLIDSVFSTTAHIL